MSFRVDRDLKKKADELFKSIGMNTSVALNMFLTQSIEEQGLPFRQAVKTPSTRLQQALNELEDIESGKINVKRYKSFEEALKDLD